jgi:hypothetical protein
LNDQKENEMKRAVIGLIMLGLAGIAGAENIAFDNGGGDGLWSNTNNWDLARLPTTGDKTTLGAIGGPVLVDAAGAATHNLTLGTALTIGSAGTLSSRAVIFGSAASITNNGTLNTLLYIALNKSSSVFVNTGDINGVGDVSMTIKGGTFNMLDGTYDSVGSLGATGTSGFLNLHGGTMTFTDVDWFDTGAAYYGGYEIDVANDGELIVSGTNMVSYFQQAITDGHLTGVNADQVTFSGGNTIVAIPEPATIGLLGLGASTILVIRRNLKL